MLYVVTFTRYRLHVCSAAFAFTFPDSRLPHGCTLRDFIAFAVDLFWFCTPFTRFTVGCRLRYRFGYRTVGAVCVCVTTFTFPVCVYCSHFAPLPHTGLVAVTRLALPLLIGLRLLHTSCYGSVHTTLHVCCYTARVDLLITRLVACLRSLIAGRVPRLQRAHFPFGLVVVPVWVATRSTRLRLRLRSCYRCSSSTRYARVWFYVCCLRPLLFVWLPVTVPLRYVYGLLVTFTTPHYGCRYALRYRIAFTQCRMTRLPRCLRLFCRYGLPFWFYTRCVQLIWFV